MKSVASILVYTRPGWVEQYSRLAQETFREHAIELISEHRVVDQTGLVDFYYSHLAKSAGSVSLLDERWVCDAILRDRWLRSLGLLAARRHLFAMAGAISEVLRTRNVRFILSFSVDSFVVDLLSVVGQHYGAKFVGIVPSFLNNYFRITTRGEVGTKRLPTDEEVEASLSLLLRPGYAPDFLRGALAVPFRTIVARWLANWMRPPYFSLRRLLSRDPYNLHYQAQIHISRENRVLFPPFLLAMRNWESAIAGGERKLVYCPLQLYPEATIDYWCEQPSAIDYHEQLFATIQKLSRRFLVVMKEHPGAVAHRNRSALKRLKSLADVVWAPTFLASNRLLEKAHAVLVWSGTVGFEAALRGIPVLTRCIPYYASGPRYLHLHNDFDVDAIWERVEALNAAPVTRDEQVEQVRFLLSGLLPGRFKSDKTWRCDVEQDRKDVQRMASSIREALATSACLEELPSR